MKKRRKTIDDFNKTKKKLEVIEAYFFNQLIIKSTYPLSNAITCADTLNLEKK